jgi:hypothetical protein
VQKPHFKWLPIFGAGNYVSGIEHFSKQRLETPRFSWLICALNPCF